MWARKGTGAALGAAMLLVACGGDRPTAPKYSPRNCTPVTSAAITGFSGSWMQMSDGFGATLSLDVTSREFTNGDGRVYRMDPARAAKFATYMEGLSNGDDIAAALGQSQNTPWKDTDPTPTGPPNAEDRAAYPCSVAPRTADLPLSPTFQRVQYRKAPNTREPLRTPGSNAISASLGSEPCLDIARQISYQTEVWRRDKELVHHALTTFLNSLSPVGTDAYGHPIVQVPNVGDLATAYDQAAADLMHDRIVLDYLAMQYSIYGCWSGSWPGVTSLFSGASAGNPGMTYGFTCHTETWEISYDGGQTWDRISVRVCQYEVQMA